LTVFLSGFIAYALWVLRALNFGNNLTNPVTDPVAQGGDWTSEDRVPVSQVWGPRRAGVVFGPGDPAIVLGWLTHESMIAARIAMSRSIREAYEVDRWGRPGRTP
jgi:hypothetical protein